MLIEDDARAQRGWWFVAISLLERPSVYQGKGQVTMSMKSRIWHWYQIDATDQKLTQRNLYDFMQHEGNNLREQKHTKDGYCAKDLWHELLKTKQNKTKMEIN